MSSIFVKTYSSSSGPPLKPLGPVRYNKTTHKSVTLSWKQRTLDTFPVSRYIIEMLDPRTEKWRQVGETAENVTTYCVPKLPEDTELKFRVIAVNDAGKSVPLIGKKMRTALRGTSEYGMSMILRMKAVYMHIKECNLFYTNAFYECFLFTLNISLLQHINSRTVLDRNILFFIVKIRITNIFRCQPVLYCTITVTSHRNLLEPNHNMLQPHALWRINSFISRIIVVWNPPPYILIN